jgi:hypothetical protein
MDIITDFLKSLVEGFRLKNPSLYAVLFVLILSAIYVADVLTAQTICEVGEAGFEECRPFLKEPAEKIVTAVERALIFIVALLGVDKLKPS